MRKQYRAIHGLKSKTSGLYPSSSTGGYPVTHGLRDFFFGDDAMKEIPLTRGMVALVDDSDWEWLNRWKWFTHVSGGGICYAARTINFKDRNPIRIVMHRAILRPPPHLQVDHIDGNGLNNQRLNLREATQRQNNHNVHPRWGKSQYKGVSFKKGSPRAGRDKWQARIHLNNKPVYLGVFPLHQEIEAAKAYDAKARELFGEFANLNFPDLQE